MTESRSATGSSATGPDGTGETSTPDSDRELTRDDVFHILQSQRRRRVLGYIRTYGDDGYAEMRDIAEHIAALEHDTTVDGLHSQQRQRVYIALYQSHLPKMDDADVIDYDQDRGHVETTEHTARFDEYLDDESVRLAADESVNGETDVSVSSAETAPTDRSKTEWHLRYLCVSGGSFLMIAAVSSGLLSHPLFSDATIGVVVAAVFTLLAVSHWMAKAP